MRAIIRPGLSSLVRRVFAPALPVSLALDPFPGERGAVCARPRPLPVRLTVLVLAAEGVAV